MVTPAGWSAGLVPPSLPGRLIIGPNTIYTISTSSVYQEYKPGLRTNMATWTVVKAVVQITNAIGDASDASSTLLQHSLLNTFICFAATASFYS